MPPARRPAMSRHNSKSGARHDGTNFYSEIADRIIADLEAGRVSCAQPWGTSMGTAPLGLRTTTPPIANSRLKMSV